MTDKDFAETKARVRMSIDRWFDPLGLRMWRDITFYYHHDPTSMAEATGNPCLPKCAAETTVSWHYLDAAIHFNLYRIFGMDDEEVDYVVRHEFAHILVNEMREYRDATNPILHEERVCTRLAQIFEWLRIAAKDNPENPL